MALDIVDGNGVAKTIKTTLDGSDHVAHHRVDAVSGTVAATQSGAWSVSITGTMPAISPGTAAANLGKAEDAAHTSGDVGVLALAVRADAAVASVNAAGDYSPLLTDSTGRLHASAIANADGIGVGGAVAAVKRAAASVSVGTDQAIVAAVASKKIRVVGLVATSSAAATFTLKSKPAGGGSAISAAFSLVAGVPLVLSPCAFGWAETVSGEGLSADVATTAVAVQVLYAEV